MKKKISHKMKKNTKKNMRRNRWWKKMKTQKNTRRWKFGKKEKHTQKTWESIDKEENMTNNKISYWRKKIRGEEGGRVGYLPRLRAISVMIQIRAMLKAMSNRSVPNSWSHDAPSSPRCSTCELNKHTSCQLTPPPPPHLTPHRYGCKIKWGAGVGCSVICVTRSSFYFSSMLGCAV